jgi:hypothetical protein
VPESNPISDRFGSCWQKLSRAREHVDDLSKAIRDFWAAEPWQLEPVTDGSTDVTRVRVRHLSPVPAIISMIAGDAAHNIRSALDHFAWAAVSPSAQSTRTCFPIATAAAHGQGGWRQQVEKQLNGASAGLISAVAAMEPWEGGQEESLWAVHELDRVDKHRLLLSAAVALGRIELHGDSYELTTVKKYSGWRLDGPLPFEPAEWTPVAENTILTIPLTGPDLGGTGTTLAFDIVLAEPEPLRTTAAATAMATLVNSTEKIIRRLSPLA